MFNLFQVLGQIVRSFVGETKDEEVPCKVATEEHQFIDLSPIFATVHGCMGLPQELVDYVMDMLRGDLQALKTCSLTCKAMFASARRLTHQTLRLTPQNIQNVFTDVGRRGSLQYTRRVFILRYEAFTPYTLQPHLREFQSLDRVHTLVLEGCRALAWTSYYQLCFVHFHPTLTSLTLRQPFGSFRLIFQFALQFPCLQNLYLEEIRLQQTFAPGPIDLVDVSPPLQHLRLAGHTPSRWWPVNLTHEIRSSMTFRSVELVDFAGCLAHYVVDACVDTLEVLTIAIYGAGRDSLLGLRFANLAVLRRLTLCVSFGLWTPFTEHTLLLGLLSTITSPVFREFVFEPHDQDFCSSESALVYWDPWKGVDELLEERFSEEEDFRVIIRTGDLPYDQETLQIFATESFPLLMERGCINFDEG